MKTNKTIILLFMIGLSVLIYPHVAQYVNDYKQKKQVHAFQDDFNGKTDEEIDELMHKAHVCNEEVYDESTGFRDPFEETKEKLQEFQECLGIAEDAIFAAIEIPKLGLVIPIYLGASDENLNKGIGQVEGSSIPVGGTSTHTVLAGHRGMGTKAMFRNIDELIVGDIFYIHTMSETLEYRVNSQQVIKPHEIDSLQIEENKDLATLLTCHPYRHNYERLLIQGERAD